MFHLTCPALGHCPPVRWQSKTC